MPENHVNFVYKLDVDVHEVDVFKLAPTLLALGELIQDSNQEVNPAGRQIGVNVKPFCEGSFIVDLSIFPQTNLQQVHDLLGSQTAGQVKLLLEWIGLITGSGGIVGVVQLIRWLKGKPKAIEEIKPGEFRYTAGDDRSITIDMHVHQLFSSSRITNNIYKVYGAPMEDQSSVADIRTYLEGESKTEVIFERSEVPIVREFMDPSAWLTSSGETVKDHIQEGVFLNPKRGSFENDPRDLSFHRGRGRNDVITATIKDKTFLQDYADGKYRLLSSDLLTVTLLERQTVEGTIVKKPVYEILRVTNYIKGPEQKTLPGV